MNADYFQICYYNLREKWLRGGIKAEEWDKIEQRQLMYMEEQYEQGSKKTNV